MEQSLTESIRDQTARALWEVQNVIACIPDALWDKPYCGAPLWQHVYHTLLSLDRWLINPNAYTAPAFHMPGLNDLDEEPDKRLTRAHLDDYFAAVQAKITAYLAALRPEELEEAPAGCRWTRFTLILAQHRHLHTHMGMLMGFIIAETGRWPRVLGLEHDIPSGAYDPFF